MDIYKTEKSYKEIMSISLSDLNPVELRTLWNCMQMSDPSEHLELMNQEINFLKEMKTKRKANLNRNASGSAIKEGEKRKRRKDNMLGAFSSIYDEDGE